MVYPHSLFSKPWEGGYIHTTAEPATGGFVDISGASTLLLLTYSPYKMLVAETSLGPITDGQASSRKRIGNLWL